MGRRKKRIDKRVTAHMSYHHVGWFVADAGYTFSVPDGDYGIDAFITTFDQNGEVENGVVYVQLKSSRHVKVTAAGYKFVVDMRDADYWAANVEPVYLVYYDVNANVAAALYVQRYIESNKIEVKNTTRKSFTVVIPSRPVDAAMVQEWRAEKNRVMQSAGLVTHV